jgi:gliding motility-associated-like protein
MKQSALLIFMIICKALLCQNFSSFNSTPYSTGGVITYNDSSENKYTFGQIIGAYSSSKFSFNVPGSTTNSFSIMLIKYDSLNSIVFYKILIAEGAIVKCTFYKNNLYVVLFSKSQYTYDNVSYSTSNNLIILKISASTGNIVSSYSYPILPGDANFNNYSFDNHKDLYIFNDRIHLILIAKNQINFLSTPIDSGLFCVDYDINGNFLFAKNLPKGTFSVSGMLSYHNSIYLSGKFDSTVVPYDILLGYLYKLDTNFNLNKNLYYEYETMSPILLNNNILFAAYPVYGTNPYKNKLLLCIADTNLNIIKETSWGLENELFSSNGFRPWRENSFSHLNIAGRNIVFCFVSGQSQDSIIGCNAKGKTSSNVFINTLDTNLNCLSNIQISNAMPYIFNNSVSGRYVAFNEELSFSSDKQISALLNAHRAYNIVDTPFQLFLNGHRYPLYKVARGNLDNLLAQQAIPSPNIVSFYADRWLETFLPDKLSYCVGDTLKLSYKKFGEWNPGTSFRLELSSNPDFPPGSVRLIGTFTDPVTTNDSILYTHLKIPNLGGGSFYLRIRSIGPDRISNLADTTVLIYNPAGLNAGADITVCEGDTAYLHGSSTVSNFYWTSSITNLLDDSLALNPKIFTKDSLQCILHAINAQGCENRDTMYIRVIPKIDLKLKIDSLLPACVNGMIKVSVSTSFNDSILLNWGEGVDTLLKTNSHILSHAYLTPGEKKLSVKAIANKCLDSTGFTFMVREPIQFTSTKDTTVCKGRFITVQGKATGGDSAFIYILKSPSSTLLDTTGIFLLKADTNTVYRIGAISLCANDTFWNNITVTVKAPLSLHLNATDTNVCKGSIYTIKANASGGNGIYYYSLKKNNASLQSNTTGSFQIPANTNEIYWISLTDSCTVDNDSLKVDLNIFDSLYFKQNMPDIYLCPGDKAVLRPDIIKGNNILSFQWLDGSGNILGNADTLEIQPASSERIILKISNACANLFDTVWVYRFAEAIGTKLLADNLSGCTPLTVSFETPQLSYSNAQPCEALWNFGDGAIFSQAFTNTSSSLIVKHTYLNPGVYTAEARLKFKSANAICYSFSVNVEALIVPQLTLNIAPKKITLPNTSCTASITTYNSDSVVVDWADGFSDWFTSSTTTLSSFSKNHEYADTGHYMVKATAYNKNTCYTEATFPVFHSDSFTCYIPSAFSPNKDATNEIFKPVLTYYKSYDMRIYDRWGSLVFHEFYTTGNSIEQGWNGDEYPAGSYIYIMQARDGENKNHTVKGAVMLLR